MTGSTGGEMNKKVAIFDLDGTLVDSLEAISKIANSAFKDLGLKGCSLEDTKYLIGNGISGIAQKILSKDATQEEVENTILTIKKYYKEYWNYKLKLYDGIEELLDYLTQNNIKLAIYTNKDERFALETVGMVLSKWSFTHVVGASDDHPKKPDSYGIDKILGDLGLVKEEGMYFGDMEVDVETGKNSQMYTVYCNWGFGNYKEMKFEEDLFLENPMDFSLEKLWGKSSND